MAKRTRTFRIFLSLTISSSMLFSSCVAQKAVQNVEGKPSPPPVTDEVKAPAAEQLKEPAQGISHIVKKGENLYRIAKMYKVDVKELAELNGIKNPAKIQVGQPIFIPGAVKKLPLPLPDRKAPADYKGAKFFWPLSGKVSSEFGDKRHGHYHSGIDILAPYGTEVIASRDGIVVFSEFERGYGRMVIIDHEDGSSTVYAHNSENCVHIHDRVSKGTVVARVGTSGHTSGSHLHFEIRVEGDSIDPIPYLE